MNGCDFFLMNGWFVGWMDEWIQGWLDVELGYNIQFGGL